MNLHGIVAGAVGAVNPLRTIGWVQSNGYITGPDGTQVPHYLPEEQILAQVQPLSRGEVEHLDGLNIMGTLRGVYISGAASSVIRSGREGGDLFRFSDPVGGSATLLWLAVSVFEQWPNWVKLAVLLQNDQ